MDEARKQQKVKLNDVYIHKLEPFTDQEVELIKKLTGMPEKGIGDWQFHTPDDEYYSKKHLNAYTKILQKWYDNTDQPEPELNAPIVGYRRVPGMAEYYVFKREGKFYTVAANKFEYSSWFLGGDFEIISKIYEFTDLGKAIAFVKKDAKTLSTENPLMTGYQNIQHKLTEAEMSIIDADEVFEKYSDGQVRAASLLGPDELKAAYRKLAIANHPDKGGHVEVMQKINTAYEALRSGKGGSGSGPRSSKFRAPKEDDFYNYILYGLHTAISQDSAKARINYNWYDPILVIDFYNFERGGNPRVMQCMIKDYDSYIKLGYEVDDKFNTNTKKFSPDKPKEILDFMINLIKNKMPMNPNLALKLKSDTLKLK